MKELVATGKVNGEKVVVLCETDGNDWRFTFNGKENQELDSKLRELMKAKHRIGNYSPKTMKLNLCAIFDECSFFDRDTRNTEIFGEIEQIPFESGVAY